MSITYRENLYYLEERNYADISPLWQWIQVFFYMCCIVSGFTVCYCFSNAINIMDQNCILNAKIEFDKDIPGFNSTVIKHISLFHSSFESIYCDVVIYIPVLITSYASFFMVLFIMCGRGGTGSQIPGAWRLVLPAIFFSFTCFCLSVFSTYLFHWGLKVFVEQIATARGVSHLDLIQIRDLHLQGVNVGTDLVKYLITTKHALRTLVSFWGLNFCWVFLRCIFNVDFQLVRTTIRVYSDSSHSILRPDSETLDKSENTQVIPDYISDEKSHPPSSDNTARYRSVHFSHSAEKISTPRKSIDVSSSPDPNLFGPNKIVHEDFAGMSSDSSTYLSLEKEDSTSPQNEK